METETGAARRPTISILFGETVARFWDVIAGDDVRARFWFGVNLVVMMFADVTLLYATGEAIRDRQAGSSPLRALALFTLAAVLSSVEYRALMARGVRAFGATVERSCERIVDGLQRAELLRVEEIGDDRALQCLLIDARRVAHAGTFSIMAFKAVLLAAGIMIYLTFKSSLAIATFGFGLLAASTFALRQRSQRLLTNMSQIAAMQGDLGRLSAGLVRGFKQVKQHEGRRAELLADVRAQATSLQQARHRLYRDYFADDSLARTAFFALLGVNAFVLPLVLDDAGRVVAELNMAVIYVSRSVALLISSLPELTVISASWARLRELETALAGDGPVLPAAEPALALPAPRQTLSFHHVSFSYGQESGFHLGPLDLTIRAGETLFVTGSNGSGKSTFLKLLTGLYRPTGGHIQLDGQPLADDAVAHYRELFAAIFSDVELFARPYGLGQVSRERVERLLAEMDLGETVSFDGERFSTLDLSSGQRKRLALVVAMLHDRPIYVFDEWAADQDPEFRERFYHAVLPELKQRGRTVIAVTHDDHKFALADRRIELGQGRLVAS